MAWIYPKTDIALLYTFCDFPYYKSLVDAGVKRSEVTEVRGCRSGLCEATSRQAETGLDGTSGGARRGHGESDLPDGDYGFYEMTADALAVVDAATSSGWSPWRQPTQDGSLSISGGGSAIGWWASFLSVGW